MHAKPAFTRRCVIVWAWAAVARGLWNSPWGALELGSRYGLGMVYVHAAKPRIPLPLPLPFPPLRSLTSRPCTTRPRRAPSRHAPHPNTTPTAPTRGEALGPLPGTPAAPTSPAPRVSPRPRRTARHAPATTRFRGAPPLPPPPGQPPGAPSTPALRLRAGLRRGGQVGWHGPPVTPSPPPLPPPPTHAGSGPHLSLRQGLGQQGGAGWGQGLAKDLGSTYREEGTLMKMTMMRRRRRRAVMETSMARGVRDCAGFGRS